MFGIPNPQFLLQPWKNLKHFSEELYAAYKSRAPIEREGPVTIRVREGQTALKIVRGPSGDDAPPANAVVRKAPPPTTPSRPREPQKQVPDTPRRDLTFPEDVSRARVAESPEPGPVPLMTVEGPVEFKGSEPVKFDRPFKVYNPSTRKYYTPPAFDPPQVQNPDPALSGGGTTVFVGKVQSGQGNTYQVVLYQDGPDGSPDPSPVKVTIPMIDPNEKIDAETWLYGIFQFTDKDGNLVYSCQPPVWMA